MSKISVMFAAMGYMIPIVAWNVDEPYTMDLFCEKMGETDMVGMDYFERYEPFHT